jgi:AraC-like DNA-binding protein
MYQPTLFALTPHDKLTSLVEQRTSYDTNRCQFNVFETHQQAHDFHLSFPGFTFTSMLRGKKVMHLDGIEKFDYLPGESVMASADQLMRIDFPEAELDRPTQCTALVIENSYLSQQLEYINERSGRFNEFGDWNLDLSKIVLKNNYELSVVSTRLMKLFADTNPLKDIYIDLALKEFVLCILRLQNLQHNEENSSSSKFMRAVIAYIKTNITADITLADLCKIAGMSKSAFYTSFTHEYGITPKQLIIKERIQFAKNLLSNEKLSVKEVSYASGFSDPNYFIRTFKKQEGITPGEMQKLI